MKKLYGWEYFKNITLTHSPSNTIYYSGKLPPNLVPSTDILNKHIWKEHLQPFACIYSCEQTQTYVLIRDHLGIEPLYYYVNHEKIIVAQTIPDILHHLPFTPALSEKKIKRLFDEDTGYSDETLYAGIYRVEPGTIIHVKKDGMIEKCFYWRLNPYPEVLHYSDTRDYLAHFSTLMKEAVQNAIADKANIACEYSGGLDSSAIYTTLRSLHRDATLYQHAATPGTEHAHTYNDLYEQAFLSYYPSASLHRIHADNFDPFAVFEKQARWFGEAPPSIFTMFADPLLTAIKKGQHTILLSGFGGDQCVSSITPSNFYVHALLRKHAFSEAWQALERMAQHPIKRTCHLLCHLHPYLYKAYITYKTYGWKIRNRLRLHDKPLPFPIHPTRLHCYKNRQEGEYALLQGIESGEIRFRIEYSSIVAKKMGFAYRYPLLYPKLLEFMLALPHKVRCQGHETRYLIKQYLAESLPSPIFDSYQKKEGLAILPSTIDFFKARYKNGHYDHALQGLSYAHLMRIDDPSKTMRNLIRQYMIHAALCYRDTRLNNKDSYHEKTRTDTKNTFYLHDV